MITARLNQPHGWRPSGLCLMMVFMIFCAAGEGHGQTYSCSSEVDLWFANDESGSVTPSEFNDALDFIYQVTDEFEHDRNTGAQSGIIGWGSDPAPTDIVIPVTDTLNDPDDSGLVSGTIITDGDGRGVREVYVNRASSSTGTQLNKATNRLADLINGGNGRRAGVPQVAIILTDAPASQINNTSFNGGGFVWEAAAANLRNAGPEGVRIAVVLLAEAADAYDNNAAARATIDDVIGDDGIVVRTSSYAMAADPANGYIEDTVEAICGISGPSQEDYSDAPTSGTSPDGSGTNAYGEATHAIVSGIGLGLAIDAETASIASADATGDGPDDDGVAFPALVKGEDATIGVQVSQAAAGDGYLQGWIDWNGDGDFADAGEQVATDLQSAGAGTTIINVPVTVPAGATMSQTFARFRWSTTSGLDATTAAGDGEVEDYAVTIAAAGIDISGTVFFDTGAGAGATAHNGVTEGDEAGAPGVKVQLVNTANGQVIDATETDGSGGYAFTVPATLAGTDVTVRTVAPAGARNISSAVVNMTDGSTLDGEAIATLASGTGFVADFGLAPASRLVEGQSVTVAPGGVADIAHTFTAGTALDVDLSITGLTSSSTGSFTTTLWRDADCSGDISAGETVLSATQSLATGEALCLVARVEASDGLASGATVSFDITANAALSGTAETEDLANTDRVTVNDGAALTLQKQVCNANTSACDVVTGAGFGSSNRGAPGDQLVYRLVFENPTSEPLEDVRVHDRTPDYSATIAAGADVVSQPSSVSCSLVQPASPVPAGFEGVVEWTCPGPMAPGDRGVVSFTVEIAN